MSSFTAVLGQPYSAAGIQAAYPLTPAMQQQPYAVHPAAHSIAITVPPGTYPPGTALVVGSHNVVIERYLSEGGFAHVYVVRLDVVVGGTDVAVLKRVAVSDKESLGILRTEVDTMRRLKGHKNIVSYIDSHASHLKTGGYEVFLLMEYCSGGGLIDFMNTRLQNRFRESEILEIIGDVAEGVACMHYLDPPLLHRDLKVENVLISGHGHYKVADFGSSSRVIGPGMTGHECRLIEDDIQKHTTMQYRSPEMVDVYRRLPIDEKSDIWALGVLLYKLCYYTTPFEEQGQLAILNATFQYPPHPQYSDRLKRLIAVMLRENPRDRPNIYLVVKEICAMRGIEVPIKDKYTIRAEDDRKRMPPPKLAPQQQATAPMSNVIRYEKPKSQQRQAMVDIKPMRRGRLPPPAQRPASEEPPEKPRRPPPPVQTNSELDERPSYLPSPSPSPSPIGQDEINDATDIVSGRFPSIDVINRPSLPRRQSSLYSHESERSSLEKSRSSIDKVQRPLPARPSFDSEKSSSSIYQPQPQRPVLMAQPSGQRDLASVRHSRSQSAYTSAQVDESKPAASTSRPSSRSEYAPGRAPLSRGVTPSTSRAPSGELAGARSNGSLFRRTSSTSSASGRNNRPLSMFIDSSVDFLRNLGNRSATASPSGSVHSSYENGTLRPVSTGMSRTSDHIESNVDFLKSLDTGGSNIDYGSADQQFPPEKRSFSAGSNAQKHAKRPSVSTSRSRLSGKFSEAFKKFEHSESRSPSPEKTAAKGHFRRASSLNIFGRNSSRNEHRAPQPVEQRKPSLSSDSNYTDEPREIRSKEPPSQVREAVQRQNSHLPHLDEASAAAVHEDLGPPLPKRRQESPSPRKPARPEAVELALSQAAALKMPRAPEKSTIPATISVDLDAYSKSHKGEESTSQSRRPRATSIQNRVHQLLDQSQAAPVARAASGYGHYTDKEGESSDEPVKTRTKRAGTIGKVEDSIVPETYVKIEPLGDLETEIMSSDLGLGGHDSRYKEFDEERFLAQARKKAAAGKNHGSHHSTSDFEVKPVRSLGPHFTPELHRGHASHKSDTGFAHSRTETSSDDANSGLSLSRTSTNDRKPAPPPKPVKLQVGTPSPKRVAKPYISPIANRDEGDEGIDAKDWQETFNKRFPSLSGLQQVETRLRDMDLDSVGVGESSHMTKSSHRSGRRP